MFRTEDIAKAKAPLLGALKAAVPALAFAAGLAAAPLAAQASTYVIQDVDMTSPRILRLSGSGFTSVNVKATPVQFDGYIQGAPNEAFENLVAFCVDVYHPISLTEYNPGLTYTDQVLLEHNSHWDPTKREFLSDAEIKQIGMLVNYGTQVFYNDGVASSLRYNELAAVQGAIWNVASGLTVTAVNNGTSTNNAVNLRLSALSNQNTYSSNFLYKTTQYVSDNFTLLTPFKGGSYPKAYPYKGLTQSFAIAAVPEPGTWVMLIGGFAFTGAMLRRARSQAVPVRVRH